MCASLDSSVIVWPFATQFSRTNRIYHRGVCSLFSSLRQIREADSRVGAGGKEREKKGEIHFETRIRTDAISASSISEAENYREDFRIITREK